MVRRETIDDVSSTLQLTVSFRIRPLASSSTLKGEISFHLALFLVPRVLCQLGKLLAFCDELKYSTQTRSRGRLGLFSAKCVGIFFYLHHFPSQRKLFPLKQKRKGDEVCLRAVSSRASNHCSSLFPVFSTILPLPLFGAHILDSFLSKSRSLRFSLSSKMRTKWETRDQLERGFWDENNTSRRMQPEVQSFLDLWLCFGC